MLVGCFRKDGPFTGVPALRVMRLVGAANKTEARSMIADKVAAPLDTHEAPIKVAPDSHQRRKAVTKGHKKRVHANKRRSRLPAR